MHQLLQEKKQKCETSGEGAVVYTEVDNLVLDILGRESPLVDGLGLPESDPHLTGPEASERTSKCTIIDCPQKFRKTDESLTKQPRNREFVSWLRF